MEKKDYEKALMDFDKAIGIKSDYAYAYNNRGNVYYKLNKFPEAIKDYNKGEGDKLKFYLQSGDPTSATIQGSDTLKWGNSLIKLENVNLQSLNDVTTIFFDIVG